MNIQKVSRILCLLLAVLVLFGAVVRPMEVQAADNTSLYPKIYNFDITSNLGYELVVWGKILPTIEYGDSTTDIIIPCPCIVSQTWTALKQSSYKDYSDSTYHVTLSFPNDAYTVNGFITSSNSRFNNDSSGGDSSETDPTEDSSSGSGSSGSGSSGSGSSGSGSSGSGSSGSGSSGSGSSGNGSSDSNSILESISDVLGNISQNISGIGNTITSSISSALSDFWGGVKSAILSIPETLSDIWEWIKTIPQVLVDALAEVFVPAEGYLDAKVQTLLSRYSFLKSFNTDVTFLKNKISALGTYPPTISVPLGNSETSYSIGSGWATFLDLSWYEKYKPTVDLIISPFLWILFIWKLFLKLPGIIGGLPGDFVMGGLNDFGLADHLPSRKAGYEIQRQSNREYIRKGGK